MSNRFMEQNRKSRNKFLLFAKLTFYKDAKKFNE
jgi:hypothetical protein